MTCPTPHKTRFTSENRALYAAVRVAEVVGHSRVYKCPGCRGWHLTKVKHSRKQDFRAAR